MKYHFQNYEKRELNKKTINDKIAAKIVQSHVNKLRDLAVKIEAYHLKTAMALMLLAKFGRPGGSFINSRINLYESHLKGGGIIKNDLNKAVQLLLPHLAILKTIRSEIENSDLEIKKILDKLINLCEI